jgi:transcriptional regulator with XRE-family HTH domain
MEERNAVGTNLFNIRNQKGETQEQVAESVGISYVSLSRYETGQRMPKMNILAKLADHYGVTVDSLIGTDTKKEPAIPDRLDDALIDMLVNLSPEEVQRVQDFVAGMKAAKTT